MLITWRGCPCQIRMDNGPELISHHLEQWAQERKVTLAHIQPGKPAQNAYILNHLVDAVTPQMRFFQNITDNGWVCGGTYCTVFDGVSQLFYGTLIVPIIGCACHHGLM